MTTPKRAMAAAVLLAGGAGCLGTPVDVDKDDLADYTSWNRIDVVGEVPGHGDSYRVIYVNDTATEVEINPVATVYASGSVIVKEIRDRDGDQPGPIRYFGVMRNLLFVDAPDGSELYVSTPVLGDHGWLFTYIGGDDIGAGEEFRASCWESCHVAAPFDGTFYDYGLLGGDPPSLGANGQ